MSRSPDDARVYFWAALIEDMRTDRNSHRRKRPTPARSTLQELYSETEESIAQVNALVIDTTDDPFAIAGRFHSGRRYAPPFTGFRSYWRKLEWLDRFERDQLVFVGGSYASPAGIKALRAAVYVENLQPVVVREFVDFTKNAHKKSRTLLERCAVALVDVSNQSGWDLELPMIQELKMPAFATHFAYSTADKQHVSAMADGLEQEMGLKPVAVGSHEQMTSEASRWLRSRPELRPQAPFTSIGLTDAAKAVTALGSNFPLGAAAPGAASMSHVASSVPTTMDSRMAKQFASSRKPKTNPEGEEVP